MEQEIKVIVLQKGDVMISKIEEVAALDIGQPDCKLISPYSLGQDLELTPWLGNITDDNVIMISSDKIVTIVEPHRELIDKYLKLATTE